MTKKITIIGGGASGTLLAVNLLKSATEQLEINLVEKRERFGRGVAYSTETDFHLLNVPAAKMGAFPDDIEHFRRWLDDKNFSYQPNDFVPRRIYGEYLRDVFRDAAENKSSEIVLNVFDDEAVDVSVTAADELTVTLASGENIQSDKVILAFGNFLPPHPNSREKSFTSAAKYFQSPWNHALFDKLDANDDIFIIGTGLTAVDVILTLYHAEHRGNIYAFSTRGLLPAVHQLGFTYPAFEDELQSQTRITDLLKIVRRHITRAESEGSNWRAVIDALRPQTQSIWQNLPEPEKRYFMQHLSRYWNVARHRMPLECYAILEGLQIKNQLEILKGRLRNIAVEDDEKFTIFYGADQTLKADAVINCIGSESNFERVDSLLVKNLLRKGMIKPDSLKMGLDATADGKIINARGEASDKLLTLGTALKGILWETTAMPEIRQQANRMALSLLNGSG